MKFVVTHAYGIRIRGELFAVNVHPGIGSRPDTYLLKREDPFHRLVTFVAIAFLPTDIEITHHHGWQAPRLWVKLDGLVGDNLNVLNFTSSVARAKAKSTGEWNAGYGASTPLFDR